MSLTGTLFFGIFTENAAEPFRVHINSLSWLCHLIHINHIFSVFIFNGLHHSLWLSKQFWVKHLTVLFRSHVDTRLVLNLLISLLPATTFLLLFAFFTHILKLVLKTQMLLVFIYLINFSEFLQFFFEDLVLDLLFAHVLDMMDECNKVIVLASENLLVSSKNLICLSV